MHVQKLDEKLDSLKKNSRSVQILRQNESPFISSMKLKPFVNFDEIYISVHLIKATLINPV